MPNCVGLGVVISVMPHRLPRFRRDRLALVGVLDFATVTRWQRQHPETANFANSTEMSRWSLTHTNGCSQRSINSSTRTRWTCRLRRCCRTGHGVTSSRTSRTADAATRVFCRAAARGESVAQYPNGVEGRAADIESGSARPAAEQRDDLRRSIYELEGEYAASKWVGVGLAPFGDVQIIDLPFYRMREVAIHHVDLDIGYRFSDLPEIYVRLEVSRLEMQWKARQPMGLTPLPDAALALEPPERLAWMMGRTVVDGLAPAAIF